MKRIASRDNPHFKALRQLASDASTRRDEARVLIEGAHLADAFLRAGGSPRQAVVAESALGRAEVVDLLERLQGVEVLAFEDALFDAVSALPSSGGILLTIDRPVPGAAPRVTRNAVLLDRVQDPGNVGSILRTAAAAGIRDIFLSRGCAGAWSPKVVRAAMGAHFVLALFEDCDLTTLPTDEVPWLATSPHATESIYTVDLGGPVAWLFGHEGQGVDEALMRRARGVRIPQPGAMESLNVAASAAICLFTQVREQVRRREGGLA
jgi:TrmH family RNA methyltransferase